MPPFGLQKTVFCISTHRKRRQQRRSSVGTKTASVTDKYRPKTVKTPHPIAHISTNRRKSKNISKLRLHTIFAIFYARTTCFPPATAARMLKQNTTCQHKTHFTYQMTTTANIPARQKISTKTFFIRIYFILLHKIKNYIHGIHKN